MNEKKWTDDERDEAFDRGMETMQRVALELYRRGREPLLAELEEARRLVDQLGAARDKAEAELRELQRGASEALAQAVEWQRERDDARAQRDAAIARITEVGVMVATNGNELAKDAYRRGAEAMREACANAMHPIMRSMISRTEAAQTIRALPIPEEP